MEKVPGLAWEVELELGLVEELVLELVEKLALGLVERLELLLAEALEPESEVALVLPLEVVRESESVVKTILCTSSVILF